MLSFGGGVHSLGNQQLHVFYSCKFLTRVGLQDEVDGQFLHSRNLLIFLPLQDFYVRGLVGILD